MKPQDKIAEDCNLSIKLWRECIGYEDILTHEVLDRDSELYSPSYDAQFQLEKLFFEIIRKSRVKYGDYWYVSEDIYPYKSHNQDRNFESRLFGSEITFGTNADQFFIRSTVTNAECVWAQHDDWWSNLFTLINEHDFYFYEDMVYQESGKRNVSMLLQRLSEHVTQHHNTPDVGWLFITFGNVFDAGASMNEAVEIFKLLHKINHGLYRTKYSRSITRNP